MRCISPLLIRQNGERHTVPCSKCNFCLQTKRNEWSFRLSQETKVASAAHFLTLTYDDDQLPINAESGLPQLQKDHYQKFMKRLRKFNSKFSKETIRYYSVGEYGTKTERPHYHAIMFNLALGVENELESIWQYGFVDVGDVTPASIHYVTKYVINRYDDCKGREPPFSVMSRRPGLGLNYLKTHTKWHREGLKDYTQVNGKKGRIPRLFRDRIFTQLERERMRIESVQDSDIRYWEEIERLSQFHTDPELYYDEAVYHSHEQLKKNANKLNKF